MPEELLEFDHYLSKTYRKTAALMARSRDAATPCSYRRLQPHAAMGGCSPCSYGRLQPYVSQALSSEAAALLGDHPPEVQAALQAYGRHLGIAYQVLALLHPPTLSLGLALTIALTPTLALTLTLTPTLALALTLTPTSDPGPHCPNREVALALNVLTPPASWWTTTSTSSVAPPRSASQHCRTWSRAWPPRRHYSRSRSSRRSARSSRGLPREPQPDAPTSAVPQSPRPSPSRPQP